MDSMRKQIHQSVQYKLKIAYKTWQQELLSKRFLKEIKFFWFLWCSTCEDLSIDVSITNVGLILTKPARFLFSWYGQTDGQTDGRTECSQENFDWEITLLAARQPPAKKVRGLAIVPPGGPCFRPMARIVQLRPILRGADDTPVASLQVMHGCWLARWGQQARTLTPRQRS